MSIFLHQDGTDKPRHHQYTSIQVLRGLAAFMVVVYHLPAALNVPDFGIPLLKGGVDIFFVISGLVMVLSTKGQSPDHFSFLKQRFTRIVPFYLVMTCLMAAALLMFAGRVSTPHDLLKSLFFIPYFDDATGYVQPILGVGWTLNLELLFYILFAATMSFGRLSQMAAIGIVFAAAIAARVVFKPAEDTVLFFYTTPILFEFLAGMALGHLAGRLRKLPVWLGLSAAVLAVVSAVIMTLGFDLPRTIAIGIPAFVLVAGCLTLENYFRLHAPDMLIRLGDASYSLYLTHPIVLLAATPIIARSNMLPWISGMAVIFATVAISLASYSFIEKPLLALSRVRLNAKQVKAG